MHHFSTLPPPQQREVRLRFYNAEPVADVS